MAKYERMFVLNDPNALRISPALAEEIGLNESIVLLQIEFLISISDHERDGRRWTYQSTTHLKDEYFPWWSRATINRTIHNLEDAGLIIIGNFNKHKYDRTRWFALSPEGVGKLDSVILFQNETRSNQNETRSTQNETRSAQNETTIPETTTETTSDTTEELADPGAGAPVEPMNGGQLTAREARAILADEFTAVSGIVRLEPETEADQREQGALWWRPLKKIMELCDNDLDLARKLVKYTTQRLINDNVMVTDPNSILKTARGIWAERNRRIRDRSPAKETVVVTVTDSATGERREKEILR